MYIVLISMDRVGLPFFSFYVFGEPVVLFSCNFLLCCPSQRSAHSQVASQVATHQEIGNQLWDGEMPDSNLGLQDSNPGCRIRTREAGFEPGLPGIYDAGTRFKFLYCNYTVVSLMGL